MIGGGYVGLEFAQAMRRFGSRVTIIQRGKQLLGREDADIAAAVEELMRDEGLELLLQAEMLEVAGRSGSGVKIRVRAGGTEKALEASDILVAAGRTPNTDKIDLAKTGVELDARVHPCQRPTPDFCRQHLGFGRMCWKPGIHARG